MRLSDNNVDLLGPGVARFGYKRQSQAIGIAHIGIGAFHRGHQAFYTDRAMSNGDRDWAIAGISLRSPTVADQMNPQDGLYTVTERSAEDMSVRVIGSVREVLVASLHQTRVAEVLAAPQTRIVSFTVTEKGYCRAPDGSLDLDVADAASFYPMLADAFAQRHANGAGGLTLLSCDNLADNGEQLRRLIAAYLNVRRPELSAWFDGECRCPGTMVDRIVPASTQRDRASLASTIGMVDEAAIFTEPFTQWVIEDRFAGDRPHWEAVGAQLVGDVAPYETAKLRMLNGAHSALAYLGLEHGHSYVHQAIADPAIRGIVDHLMRYEAAATITPGAGQDLDTYADALLARFANPALEHRLIQIAMDGSQKVPQRWLATLAERQRRGEESPAIQTALAAWLRHVRGDNIVKWGDVDDPLASPMRHLWDVVGKAGIVEAMFGQHGLIPSSWVPNSDLMLNTKI